MTIISTIGMIFRSFFLSLSFLSRFCLDTEVYDPKDKIWKYYTIFYPLCAIIICIMPLLLSLFAPYLLNEKYLSEKALLTALLSSIIYLSTYYYITRAMHFDGFCDVADCLMAVGDKGKRLSALKDSNIGVGALCSGVLLLLFKFIILVAIFLSFNNELAFVFIAFSVIISRSFVVLFSATSKSIYKDNANKNISFATLNLPQFRNFFIGLILFTIPLATLILFFFPKFWELLKIYFFLAILTQFILMSIVNNKAKKAIGGVNGDFLGYFIELSEVSTLIIPLIASHLL
ncbi:adenosylcobinamide-GDP ribazoletransferase [Lentisphaerota bacterium WC36G]|nr:adenosylcobinamide-GDP ribazoletransferase [Lentisphaerae bacterium WC36]